MYGRLRKAVLWLNSRDINIRCIRLQPYRADAKTLIDVQQVIPLPEAQEYTIRIREKQQQERRSRSARFSEESQQACVDYWQGVLDELTPSGILEPGIKPPFLRVPRARAILMIRHYAVLYLSVAKARPPARSRRHFGLPRRPGRKKTPVGPTARRVSGRAACRAFPWRR
jgi:hypothetical protein